MMHLENFIQSYRVIEELSKMIKLWSKRFDSAYGWRWHIERECCSETAKQWLDVFSKDEPHIEFKLSVNKPRISK